MWKGTVISIHIAPTVGAPMVPRNSIRAVAGQGLEGDRYFLGEGFTRGLLVHCARSHSLKQRCLSDWLMIITMNLFLARHDAILLRKAFPSVI